MRHMNKTLSSMKEADLLATSVVDNHFVPVKEGDLVAFEAPIANVPWNPSAHGFLHASAVLRRCGIQEKETGRHESTNYTECLFRVCPQLK